jgi:pimeloyl-ACP methyl ester carboxylesterase
MLALLLLACKSPEVVHLDADPSCDPLVEGHCLLPFPSDRWLRPDESTVTGYRLVYDPSVLPAGQGDGFDTSAWEAMDGASPAGQIVAMFPSPPDLSGAAFHDSIDRSLDEDHPTVLFDLETGERLPHWVELDAQAQEEGRTAVFVRITERLEEDRAYAVAFRGLFDVHGEPLEASAAFEALRDGTITDLDSLEARRDSYDAMFEKLEEGGVARDELQLAWWFHTASGEAIRGDLVAMRDEAVGRLGSEGLGCTVTAVEEGYGADTSVTSARLIRGTFTMPSWLDRADAPSRLVRGADGRPVWQRNDEIEFTAVIPQSVVDSGEPAPLIFYGHGLMGSGRKYMESEPLRQVAETQGIVLVGIDWAGMSTPDVPTVASILYDVGTFPLLSERLHQGMMNQIGVSRSIAGACQADPAFQLAGSPSVDPSRIYYAGGSQGGMLGGAILAIHPDVRRGMLFVNGMSFPFTMDRSLDFSEYYPLMAAAYPDRVDRIVLLSMVQHLWDQVESAGYMHLLVEGDGEIGGKQVLAIAAENDPKVQNLSTDLAMRTAGVPIVRGSSRESWGFEVKDAPFEGSAYLTIDMGDREIPPGNVAPEVDDLGHDTSGFTPAAQAIIRQWLADGTVTMPCDGECDPD